MKNALCECCGCEISESIEYSETILCPDCYNDALYDDSIMNYKDIINDSIIRFPNPIFSYSYSEKARLKIRKVLEERQNERLDKKEKSILNSLKRRTKYQRNQDDERRMHSNKAQKFGAR
jgi:hypothetical protein